MCGISICFFRTAVTCTCVHIEARGECWVSCSVILFETGSVTELEQIRVGLADSKPHWSYCLPPTALGDRTHTAMPAFFICVVVQIRPLGLHSGLISSCSLRDPSCQLTTSIFIGEILKFLSYFILFLKSLKFRWQILVLPSSGIFFLTGIVKKIV